MDYFIFNLIKDIIEGYTSKYLINNNEDLNLEVSADVSEEEKEHILYELDGKLPDGLIFLHRYDNPTLTIVFKELK